MSQILKDLYYGNISPWEKPFIRDSEYAKEIKTFFEIDEKLLSLMNDTEKELFNAFSTADGFSDGFCLGMRIAIEVMQKRY